MVPAATLSILVQAHGIAQTQRQLGTLDASVGKSSGKMGGLLAAGAKTGGLAVVAMGAAALAAAPKIIGLASDAQETASKFKTVFGRETDNATRALDDFSKATGTSKYALREQAAGLQALIRPMGLNTKNAADMSVGLTKLATDLASFNNSSVDEAITALQSGLVGEAEPLRRFGVQLSAARVETYAYANGIAKQGAELTAAQKAQASYAIILKDTTLAQGDAERTAGSFANQWKRLKSQVTDLATELGVTLIPVVTSVINWITGFIDKLREGGGESDKLRETVTKVWDAIQKGVGASIVFLKGVLNDHRDDIENVGQAARNVWTAIKFAWEESILPMIKRVLPAIQQIVKGTFDIIGGIIKTVSSLLTGDFGAAWDGVKQIFKGALESILGNFRAYTAPMREVASKIGEGIEKALDAAWDTIKSAATSAWNAVKSAIVTPIEAAVDAVKHVLGKGKEGLVTWLGDRVDDVKRVTDLLADPFVKAFGRMTDSVKGLLDFAGKVVGAVKDIVDWVGKIKVPDVNIPFVGGGYKPGSAGGGGGRGLQLPASFSPTHQTGGLPGYPATDVFGPPGQAVFAPASGVISKLSGSAGGPGGGGAFGYSMYLRSAAGEYFLTHFGSRAVRLGQQISRGQLLGTIADYPDRPDHIHEGFHKYALGTLSAARGLALVGERGPELVSFRGGERVYSNGESRGMLGGAVVNVYLDGELVRGVARVEIENHGRALKGAWTAGIA